MPIGQVSCLRHDKNTRSPKGIMTLFRKGHSLAVYASQPSCMSSKGILIVEGVVAAVPIFQLPQKFDPVILQHGEAVIQPRLLHTSQLASARLPLLVTSSKQGRKAKRIFCCITRFSRSNFPDLACSFQAGCSFTAAPTCP